MANPPAAGIRMFFVNLTQLRKGKQFRSRNYMATVHIEQGDRIQPYLIINLEVNASGSQAVDRFSVISMNPGELDLFLYETWNASANIAGIQYAYHDPEVSAGYTIQDVRKILSYLPTRQTFVGNDESITQSQHRYYLADGSVHYTSCEAESQHGGHVIWGDDQDEDLD